MFGLWFLNFTVRTGLVLYIKGIPVRALGTSPSDVLPQQIQTSPKFIPKVHTQISNLYFKHELRLSYSMFDSFNSITQEWHHDPHDCYMQGFTTGYMRKS